MTLRLPLVEAHPSVQQGLDQLAGMFPLQAQNLTNGAVGTSQLATGIVLRLASTGTARKAAFAAATVTFPGSSQAGTALVVTHGLGATPVVLLHGENATPWLSVNFSAVGSTTFTVNVRTTDGSSPTAGSTATVYWLAIG